MEKKDKAKIDALKRELRQVHMALDNAKLRLAELEGLHKKLNELKVEVMGLETKVDGIKSKVAKAKGIGITNLRSQMPTSLHSTSPHPNSL